MGKILGWIGVLLTGAYMAGLAWLTGGRLGDLQTMELSSLGDFMAGAFGPVAILWLVLGYFQQGIELRQNSEALRLQADELKNSVIQQAALAKSAGESLRLQIEEARTAEKLRQESFKPIFIQQHTRCSKETDSMGNVHFYQLSCKILNSGNRCSNISLVTSNKYFRLQCSENIAQNGDTFTITCNFAPDTPDLKGSRIQIKCTDASGAPFEEEVHFIYYPEEEMPYIITIKDYYRSQKPTH